MIRKNLKKGLMFGASISSLLVLSGCAISNSGDSILKEQASCGNLKPVLSLEQNLKKISAEDGFSARIFNYTQFNPPVYGNSFLDIRNELQSTNLDFEIHNYADIMDVKKVSIFAKGNRYNIDKELLKIEFVAENQRYYTVEQIVKIFDKHNYYLNIPKHLYDKPVSLTPGASYKLSDLVNEVSNKLIEMSIPNTVKTSFNSQNKKNEIIVELNSLRYKYHMESLISIQSDLRANNIPNKIENGELVILGNYKQQLIAKDIIEKKTKNLSNVYIVCFNHGGDSFSSLAINDGVEAPIDTYESIKIQKIAVDSNGVEDYVVTHKTKDNQKEYKVKTNDRKITIAKEKINAKIYLY